MNGSMILAATTTTASKGSSGGSIFFLVIIVAFVALYLVVIRPQRRRQNTQKQTLSELQVGDEVLTAGGVFGRVASIDDDEVRVEIAPKVQVRVARRAIATILTEHEEPLTSGDEPEGEDGERWQSAFGDNAADGSGEEKPG